ncbi:uncharacterized protein LOC119297174 [Triticum dicoccoides]|uniref:uncharacterized protein LOC119297174 n=1 Tax=Triticum dicoccoides TaxID=85692 RepID=UPI0018907557|nr:uncharacterized protein LOC119297174 [Triticum dicoccoides]XP_044384802.1 uncharacterized protein LOC123106823 [Triticum aestivum]
MAGNTHIGGRGAGRGRACIISAGVCQAACHGTPRYGRRHSAPSTVVSCRCIAPFLWPPMSLLQPVDLHISDDEGTGDHGQSRDASIGHPVDLTTECHAATAVVLMHACDKTDTLEQLNSFWLPNLRRAHVMLPTASHGSGEAAGDHGVGSRWTSWMNDGVKRCLHARYTLLSCCRCCVNDAKEFACEQVANHLIHD